MRFYLLLLAVVFTAGLSAQTIYVNGGNATPGDGSSWATAYANLNDALLAAPAGAEVWIAAGTYVTPDTASFFIDKELTVRGGFAGTETSADAADPDTNPTILSGDVMGNDPAMTYDSTLFDDNNRVLFITDTNEVSAYTVTLDGLIIEHGGLAEDLESFNGNAGGGLRSYAKVNVSRTTFRNNYARTGGAIFIRFASSNESVFDSLTVVNNFVVNNRAIYVRDNDGVTFMNSDFQGQGSDVLMNSGIFRAFRTTNFKVQNSTFSNIFTDFSGGMAFITDSDDARIEGCMAEDLKANNSCAGVIVTSNNGYSTDRERDANDFVMDNCTLVGLNAQGWGANVYFDNVNGTVQNSRIIDAVTVRNGAAFYAQYDSDNPKQVYDIVLDNNEIDNADGGSFGGSTSILYFDTTIVNVLIKDTEIKDGVANEGRGGALYYQGVGGNVTLLNSVIDGNFGESGSFVINADDCDFVARNTQFVNNGDANLARRGGAFTAFMTEGGSITVDSCLFENNLITRVSNLFSAGGAFYLFGNDEVAMPVTITNSQFINNTADGEEVSGGGALYLSRAIDLTIDNCEFNGNTSGSIGGAIHGRTFEIRRDTADTGDITVVWQPFTGKISNSSFVNNFANGQGGAIGTFRTAFDLTNNVFVGNTVGGEGNSGGAIIFNGSTPFIDEDTQELALVGDLALSSTMINNTFVNNLKGDGDIAAGNDVALFQRGSEGDLNNPSMTVTLLNNAFLQSEQGISFEIETEEDLSTPLVPVGNVTITSLGGNFFNNEVDADLGLLTDDDTVDLMIEGEDGISAIFVDIFDDAGEGVNAQLNIPDNPEDNPLINSGVVSDLVPETDIVGNPRGNAPDIGAYEADQGAVSVGEPLANSGLDIAFFPNPTQNVLNVRNDEASIERFTLLVSDQNGRVLKARQLVGATNSVDFTNLPAGVYNLQVVVKGKLYGQQVVKQ